MFEIDMLFDLWLNFWWAGAVIAMGFAVTFAHPIVSAWEDLIP